MLDCKRLLFFNKKLLLLFLFGSNESALKTNQQNFCLPLKLTILSACLNITEALMWARRISFFIITFFHVWLHMPPTRSGIITLPRSWNALIVISLICLQSDVCRTISESNGDRYGVNRTPRIFSKFNCT